MTMYATSFIMHRHNNKHSQLVLIQTQLKKSLKKEVICYQLEFGKNFATILTERWWLEHSVKMLAKIFQTQVGNW